MEILILLLLIILNGFFALAEVAFIASEREILENRKIDGDKIAGIIIAYKNEPEKFLSSIQVGITLIGIISGVFSGLSLTDDFSMILKKTGLPDDLSKDIALLIVIGIVTYLSIILGELIPKIIGMKAPENILIKVFPIVNLFIKIFYPIVILLTITTKMIVKIFKIADEKEEEKDFIKEIVGYTAIAARKNRINKTQQDIITNAVEIQNEKIEDIMVKYSDIKTLNCTQTISEAMIEAHIHHHTRYPLIEEGEITGYINFKDIMNALKITGGKFNLKEIARPIITVMCNDAVGDTMQRLIKNHQHIAIINNEIGKTVGMITLENLLEAVVGSIEDEYDMAPNIFYSISDTRWLAGGGADMEKITKELKGIEEFKGNFREWINNMYQGELKVEVEINIENYKIIVRKISRGKVYEAIIEKQN